MVPRYYYHLTDQKWGKTKTLRPRSSGENRDNKFEPDTARICVSSSISGCFVAKYAHEMNGFYIYRTKRKVRAVPPLEVLDHKITNEYWLLDTTEFVLHAKLDTDTMSDIVNDFRYMFSDMNCALGDGKSKTEKWQKKMKVKIANFLRRNGIYPKESKQKTTVSK